MEIDEINETEEMLATVAREKDRMYYALLMEIKDLLIDIRRNTGRQISPG